MKILIILSGFFPGKKYGGPPVSVNNFCSLMSEHECLIVTKNHDFGEVTPYYDISKDWNERVNCKVKYLSDSKYGKKEFENIIKDIKPDILYLQGLFQQCILPCLILAKKYKLKVLLAPRGELCAGAFQKKYKKIPYIYMMKKWGLFKCVIFQSTSKEETEAIEKYLQINRNDIYYLPNIPSIPNQKYKRPEKKRGSAKFVFLSRIVRKKNLLSAIMYFKNISGNVIFDIYGSIEDEAYWCQCKNKISELPKNVRVRYCGVVLHDEVHEIFSQYHAFIFPTLSENFGHVIAESLIVGCPVIVSNQTPWNDVMDNHSGWVFPLDQKEGFITAIQTIIAMDGDVFSAMRNAAVAFAKRKINLNILKNSYNSILIGCQNKY